MTETEEKPKRKKSGKQGLHGWKAALAVFGCGTLAAFAVFGIIVGSANIFFSSVSSGVESPADPQVPQEASPVEELAPGELDLCGRHVMGAYLRPDPDYESGNYSDPALDGEYEERTVSDVCSWEVQPQSGFLEPVQFTYSYDSFISTSDGESAEVVASSRYDDLVQGFDGGERLVLESAETNLGDRSYYYYGEATGNGYFYHLVVQVHTSVVVMEYETGDEGGVVESERLASEARDVMMLTERAFTALVPE